MNAFEKFWSDFIANTPTGDTPAARHAAESAWDSVLCRLQAEAHPSGGSFLTAHQIAAAMSRLHSWNNTPA